MEDDTEEVRREMMLRQREIGPLTREQLEKLYGQVWDTKELTEEFEVIGFMAPCVVVRRLGDGVKGSLEFQHHERYYYKWSPV